MLCEAAKLIDAVADDPAAKVAQWRPPNPYVSTDRSFNLAQTWLTECHSSHSLCRLDPVSFMPTRLIRIDPRDSRASIQLVETKVGELLRWCSLSYVWGGDQPVKTTKATLTFNRQGIPITELPQTIQDAVTVSRRLGVYYLWVDCLCIVQDDPNDIARELAVMPHIYKHAFLTISASCAKSSDDGFLQDRGYFYTSVPPFRLRYQSSADEPGTLFMFESSPGNLDEDPIESRCWTYQERLF